MRWTKTVTMVEAHAEGEVGRVVTGGVIGIPGDDDGRKASAYMNEAWRSASAASSRSSRAAAAQMSDHASSARRPAPTPISGFIILPGRTRRMR
jgi:proline racemase